MYTNLFPQRRKFVVRWLIVVSALWLTGCVDPTLIARWQENPPIRGESTVAASDDELVAASVVEAGRLLILHPSGNLQTVDPSGGNPHFLTDDASDTVIYTQPTWSPTAEHIAWTRVVVKDGEPRGSLITSRADGSELAELELAYAPFYIYWSPLGDRLAYLSNWVSVGPPAMALRMVELDAQGQRDATLAKGVPFYFSWSPDGQRLVSHVANDRLELNDLQGEAETLALIPGLFPAPQWLPDGDRLLLAVFDSTGQRQRLITTDLTGGALNEVTQFDGRISFGVSPDSQRVAYILTDPFARMNAMGALNVIDVAGGTPRPISNGSVIAFFWSPDSRKLAFLELEEAGSELGVRWKVWDGTKVSEYDFFVPNGLYLNSYLVYFDQYIRSMTIWSPDSRAFAYPSYTANQRPIIVVQALDGDQKSQQVGEGLFVAWSPK